MNSDDGGSAGTALYAEYQTEVYQAPPIIDGRVPKNVYGNLDIYVPSMVPKGGMHLPCEFSLLLHDLRSFCADPDAARAARVIGIDYADAVTGFEFKGRHGTAVVKGIVAASEYQAALEAVMEGFHDEQAEAEATRKSMNALKLWKRFMAGLRIRERIDGYDVEGEAGERNPDEATDDAGGFFAQPDDDGGGFFPDRDDGESLAEPNTNQLLVSGTARAKSGLWGGDDEDDDAEEAMRDFEMANNRSHDVPPTAAAATAADDLRGSDQEVA